MPVGDFTVKMGRKTHSGGSSTNFLEWEIADRKGVESSLIQQLRGAAAVSCHVRQVTVGDVHW